MPPRSMVSMHTSGIPNSSRNTVPHDAGLSVRTCALRAAVPVARACSWRASSSLMLYVIDKITPVKVSKDEEEAGLDEVEHGEAAYL